MPVVNCWKKALVTLIAIVLCASVAYADVILPWEIRQTRPQTSRTKVRIPAPDSADVSFDLIPISGDMVSGDERSLHPQLRARASSSENNESGRH